jgi:tetratricopeptide (TPR) repeat protein
MKISLPGKLGEFFPLAGAGTLVLVGAAVGGTYGYRLHLLNQAEEHIGKNFHMLAAELLDPVRENLTRDERACKALVNAYFGARMNSRLEWASEACISRGIEAPEVIVGLSAAWEQTGRMEAAIQLLSGAAEKFKSSPEFSHRLGMIYQGQKNTDLAVQNFLEAHRRAPGLAKLALDYLVFFAQNQRWSEASVVAESLKDAQTEDPEVKLLIARAFQRTGRAEAARAQTEIARTLLDKAPNKKDALMRNFADLLGSESPAPAPGTPQRGRNLASEDAPAPPIPPQMPTGNRTPRN